MNQGIPSAFEFDIFGQGIIVDGPDDLGCDFGAFFPVWGVRIGFGVGAEASDGPCQGIDFAARAVEGDGWLLSFP